MIVLALVVLIVLPGLGWLDVLIAVVVAGAVLALLEVLAPGRAAPPPAAGPEGEAGRPRRESPY